MRLTIAILLSAVLTACSPAGVLNATVPEAGVDVTSGVAYGNGPRRALDIYRPRTAAGNAAGSVPLIVFLYGGSWQTGDRAAYKFVAAPLAARGAVVVVPDYRLYPDVQFPDFLRDNAAAVAWALDHAASLGADRRSVFIVGHSAGAYNAAMLALDPSLLAGVGVDRGSLAGVAALATPADFLPSSDPTVYPVFGDANTPAHQPLAYADGRGPPLLLLHGDADTTVQPRNSAVLAAKIRAAGGPVETRLYPGIGHIGLVTAFAPLFQRRAPVLDDVWAFVQAHRGSTSSQTEQTQHAAQR